MTTQERATRAANAYAGEIRLALIAWNCGQYDAALESLERAHVLQQTHVLRHAYTHWLMLCVGLARRDWREVAGQLPRIAAALVFSRIWVPRGNSGRARVSAMAPMRVPDDLRDLVA
jgi:hypothetical protein